jgi:F-type H+-transporting ATPase subunit b
MIAAETRDKLNTDTEKHRKALEGQLNAQLADAEKQIAASKTQAMANVRGIAVETAVAIVSRLIGSPPADSTAAGAVDAVLSL